MSPDQDRRAAILTMIGEAGDQGDDGMAGVGNVLLNRAQLGTAGGYADTPGAVGLQQGQFEAWHRKGRGLLAMSPQDPAYQRAAAIFDGLTSGQIGDNTKGATNFYAPAAQAALGRPAPAWGASNVTAQIGGHVFSAPKGAVMRQQQADNGVDVDALAAQWGASPKSGQGGASEASGATPAAASPGNAAAGTFRTLASMWTGWPPCGAAPSLPTTMP